MTSLIRKHLRESCTAVVAMTYNQQGMIDALADTLSPYLMVVDNGSTPPIAAPSRFAYSIIRLPANRYFAGGWNDAMPQINATWVAMLNDDISGITLEMIDDLIEKAEANGYAAISPAFNSPHVHMQPHGRGLHPVNSIDWVAAIVRKTAWDAVGGFNAEAFPGYGSDLDIAYRLRQMGYTLAVDDRHIITHLGGVAAVAGGTQTVQGNVTLMNESFQRLYHVQDWAEFTRKYLA